MHFFSTLLLVVLLVQCSSTKPHRHVGRDPMEAATSSATPLVVEADEGAPSFLAGLCDYMWMPRDATPKDVAIKAAKRGQTDVLRRLFEWGADPNIMDPETQKPLLYHAIHSGSVLAVDCLVKYGANKRWTDTNFSLLDYAVKQGKVGMVRKLVDPDHCLTTLKHSHGIWYLPIARGDLTMVQLLLNNCNKKYWMKQSLLVHQAIAAGQPHILEYLLKKGMSPDGDVNDERSPLEQAILAESPRAVALLLQYGAKLVNRHGRSLETFLMMQSPSLMMSILRTMPSLHDIPQVRHYMDAKRAWDLKI